MHHRIFVGLRYRYALNCSRLFLQFVYSVDGALLESVKVAAKDGKGYPNRH
jgi:hypothetical protein